jgi:hypothetical protein
MIARSTDMHPSAHIRHRDSLLLHLYLRITLRNLWNQTDTFRRHTSRPLTRTAALAAKVPLTNVIATPSSLPIIETETDHSDCERDIENWTDMSDYKK